VLVDDFREVRENEGEDERDESGEEREDGEEERGEYIGRSLGCRSVEG
jgi:hypothetical protein